ncbi:hypothetical protein Efla_001267 [Eimeria flavescens]
MAFQRLPLAGEDNSGSSRSDARSKKLSKTASLQRLKRKAGVLAVLFLFSILLYNAFVYSGLAGLLPFAGPSDFRLERGALKAFLRETLSGVALPLVPSNDLFDHAAVVVGPYGPVRAPYTKNMDLLMKRVTQKIWLDRQPRTTSNDFSIIISARNEEKYLCKTLEFLFNNTAEAAIREVIIVDDASAKPVNEVLKAGGLSRRILDKTRVIRFDQPQGLIRGRIAGASSALSDNLFFLDAHCKPQKGWEYPLLQHLKTNYRRVACPVIYDVKEHNWEDVGTHGSKMMFEWTFEFGWFEDMEEEIPLMSGGILAITKEWWEESGKYDPGMLEWGGENLEQSMRLWMCGGEIIVDRRSQIGHIFSRPPKPNPGNRLVIQVQKNQKRAAKVWLDEYYALFYKYHPEARPHQEGDVSDRRRLRYEQLTCMPFQWYVDKFRPAFERKALLDHDFKHISHDNTGLCLGVEKTADGPERVRLSECDVTSLDQATRWKSNTDVMQIGGVRALLLGPVSLQHWQTVSGNRMIYNRKTRKCLDAAFFQLETPILFECDWNGVIRRTNVNQVWQWDLPVSPEDAHASGRIFVFDGYWSQSLTGADIFPLQKSHLESPRARCLIAEAQEGGAAARLSVQFCTALPPGPGDPMRFSAKWVRPPLSSRFGKRTLQDAERITEEYAKDYLNAQW